ncbi:uncharacterized protein EURHEDRAFT_128489 [Aspergillus ruber CBS 135680]|uniref:Uncharacterized protein n=1 Tax=Aspergillus ruber (strain CBS 135680) TaxID=1388766 RepID=A0A017SRC5_ASPRC|nr:uncharacterized protein EURHEDRAFT_128489 [Aspergillus ruber CBS 135680]EYE99114.1 hypothetical protein EURHEDRAFT_128489 [Aspergillus ruber CBS 135680]
MPRSTPRITRMLSIRLDSTKRSSFPVIGCGDVKVDAYTLNPVKCETGGNLHLFPVDSLSEESLGAFWNNALRWRMYRRVALHCVLDLRRRIVRVCRLTLAIKLYISIIIIRVLFLF